ncbi:MAG: putative bifunctional diguanylate cyclase/phosphodiesterase [Acidimicrobiales bacterium]
MRDLLPRPDGRDPVVLVVDDDPTTRLLATAAMTSGGFDTVEATSGEEALVKAGTGRRPDAVLLDVTMSGIDGYETCRRLREFPGGADLPVVIMTARDDTDSIERAYQAGATDFAIKPLNPALLAHRMRYLLRVSNTTREAQYNARRLIQAQRLARLAQWEFDTVTGDFTWSSEVGQILGPDLAGVHSLDDLLPWVHPDDQHAVIDQLTGSDHDPVEYRLVDPDGLERIIDQEVEASTDPHTGHRRLVGAAQDVTDRRRAEQRAVRLAHYDPLTGLPNRSMLSRHIESAMTASHRSQQPLAVLALDLDLFKRVNDLHGHAAGDALLVEVADRIRSCLRSDDLAYRVDRPYGLDDLAGDSPEPDQPIAARLGGDEFVAVIPRLRSPEDAAIVAQRILDRLSSPFVLDNTELVMSASIGIAVYPNNGHDVETLFRNADAAMYAAKDRGRNTYQFFTPEMHQRSRRRSELEDGLRKALTEAVRGEGDDLQVHFQPKVSIEDNRTVGVEALVRWTSAVLGPVSPAEFIPVAEDSGLIIELGEWILAEACRAVQTLPTDDGPMSLAVNISPRQFRDPGFADRVKGVVEAAGLDPTMLELELTESTVMLDTVQASRVLDELKSFGVRVAIDDFGTGYSSLSYLTRFPFDTLKIDQSFIRQIGHDRNDAIVSAIIALSRILGLSVVAEGVEEASQRDFLGRFGQLDLQGYFLARPMPPEALVEWITDHRTDHHATMSAATSATAEPLGNDPGTVTITRVR